MTELIAVKNKLRKEFSHKRKALNDKYRLTASYAICGILSEFDLLIKAELVAAFYPVKGEPDIIEFIKIAILKGKKFCFPRFHPHSQTVADYEMAIVNNLTKDFVPGKYGIPEPKPSLPALSVKELKTIIWLVPGIAFDLEGGRIGHGKGIYDQLLKNITGLKIGISFESQLAAKLPSDQHDQILDFVVTEKGVYRCIKKIKREF